MKSSSSEEFSTLIDTIKSLNRRRYEPPLMYPQITCQLSDNTIFVNDGEAHEIKLLEKAIKYFEENPSEYNTLQEEDIIVLPYKSKSNISEIKRRIYFEGFTNKEIKGLFAVGLSGISGQIDRLFDKIIEKKLEKEEYRRENPIKIIKPIECKYEYAEFEMDVKNNVYMFVFILKGDNVYVSNPHTNKSAKHYSQRDNDKEKSVIQRYEDKKRKGMLYYNLDTIIGENGFNKNPKFGLNLFKIENYEESEELENNMKDFNFIIKLFKYMSKCKIEANQNSKRGQNYYPSPESSSLSDFSYNSNESNGCPLSPQSDDIMDDCSNEEDNRMEIDSKDNWLDGEVRKKLDDAFNGFYEATCEIISYGFGLN